MTGSKSRRAQFVLVAAGALAAVWFGSGCDEPPGVFLLDGEEDTFIVVHCDPQSKKLQTYESNVIFSFLGYETPISGALNGVPCSDSTEFQGRPYSVSEAQKLGLVSPNVDPPQKTLAAPAQVGGSPALISLFQHLQPLLFGPRFKPPLPKPPSNSNCTSATGVFLVNHLQSTVSVIGLCPLRIARTIPVTSNPLQVANTPDGSTAVVTSYDGALTLIDTTTFAVTKIDLGAYYPAGVAITPDSKFAYVTNYIDVLPSVVVVDLTAKKVSTVIPLTSQYPRVISLTPDGTQAWVLYYNDRLITIIDTLTNTIANTLSYGTVVGRGIAFNPQGTKAFVAAFPDQLYIVDTATHATLATLTVGNGANDVIALPRGDLVAVGAEYAPGTWWVNARTNKLVGHTVTSDGSNQSTMGLAIVP